MSAATRSRRALRKAFLGPTAGLLFMLGVVCGVMAMHGLQAADSPVETSMAPLVAMDGMPGSERDGPPGDQPSDDHGHPGGQVCLGLVAMAFALTLLMAGFRRRAGARSVATRRNPLGDRHGNRSPPAPGIYRLAVLRL